MEALEHCLLCSAYVDGLGGGPANEFDGCDGTAVMVETLLRSAVCRDQMEPSVQVRRQNLKRPRKGSLAYDCGFLRNDASAEHPANIEIFFLLPDQMFQSYNASTFNLFNQTQQTDNSCLFFMKA